MNPHRTNTFLHTFEFTNAQGARKGTPFKTTGIKDKLSFLDPQVFHV